MNKIPDPLSRTVRERQLKRLKPRHREIIRRLVEGKRPVDIAKQMGIGPQRLSVIMHSPSFVAGLERFMDETDRTVMERIESLSPEALDKIRDMMRKAKSESLQSKMAMEILDRAGYGKVEKEAVLTMSGEEVIKELNRRKAEQERTIEIDRELKWKK